MLILKFLVYFLLIFVPEHKVVKDMRRRKNLSKGLSFSTSKCFFKRFWWLCIMDRYKLVYTGIFSIINTAFSK